MDPLISVIKNNDADQYNAAAVLAKIKGAIGPLIQALNDKDANTRQSAVLTLGMLNDSNAIGPLVQALEDENAEVRQAAARSLTKLNATQNNEIQ